MPEQRKDPRLGLRLNVSYKIAGTAKSGKSITHDVSAGGLRFIAEHPLEAGMRLEISLRLPEGDRSIAFLGEVAWTRATTTTDRALTGGSREIGVKFLEIDAKDRQVLKQYAVLFLPPESV